MHVPFVVEVTPWFLSGCELEHDASHRPDVHRTVPTAGIVLDDLRRHVHGRTGQTTAQADAESAPEDALCRTTRSHHRTMVLGEYLRRAKVDKLDHTKVIQ